MKGTVLFTKKNALGIYGFIKDEKGDSFYFDTSCIIKGNYIQKGNTVSFEIEQMANGKTKVINVANFEYKKLDAEQRNKIEQVLSAKLSEVSVIDFAGIPAILKSIGFDYKDYSEDLGTFIQREFAGVFIIRKKVEINGKVYQAALSRFETKDLLPHEKENEIAERISTEMIKNGFVQCSTLPQILSALNVDYKSYASSITQFVEMYLAKHFVLMRNVPMNGKVLPSILVPFGSELLYNVTPLPSVKEKNTGSDFEELEKYIDEARYEDFLRSEKFAKKSPDQLGVNGILLAIKAIAGFLGDDPNIKLNDFQRALIETERASDLTQFRDDEDILRLGLQSSYVPMTMDTFKICFADVYHGKNNLNNNWNALVERFWCVKNDIAFYFNAIWLVILKKDRCVDFYIEEGAKQKDLYRIADLLRIWKHFSDSSYFTVPLRLKRKLIGNCLDCGNIESLCNAIHLFDDFTMPEAKQLAIYLQGDGEIDSDTLMSYFHSDVEALVSEKLVNLFWYRYKDREHLPEMIVRVLSSVCWDYDESYIEVILYNNTYNDFSVSQKAKILIGAFEQLCEYTKTCRKAYLLVNYIYTHIVPNYSYVLSNPCDFYSARWENLKTWMVEQVTAQLSSDVRTAKLISVFKYDDVAMHELETVYCNDYVKPELDGCFDEESLDDLVDQYRKEGIPFISQWIDSQYRKSAEHGVDTLIQEQRFSEAIRWVQTQNTLGVAKKKSTLRKIICENFKARGFNENAYDIFAHAIPVAFAETILLEGLTANEDDAIAALFATYVFQKNWLKIAYMYAPYSVTRNTMHPKLYEQVKNILIDNGIDANKYAVSHFDVIKTAIRVLGNNEFDEFIEWAKKIQIPYGSKLYDLKPKTFDAVIKNMLTGADYNSFWDQLIMQVLRTDNAEQQDMLRYSIITSYIGRFGAVRFESMISTLLKWKGPGKDYYGYYTSIWKGLFTGKYGCNLLSLNVPLINEAPITYWNLFYDIAVCKNHVFSLDGLWGTQWHNPVYNIQEFYSAIVERYSESRETIFLQIAVKLLEQCDETVITEFDKYLSYCNSNKSKDFLFQAIIAMLKKKKYLNEIGTFLRSGYWYNTETERKLSLVLELICDNDHEKFNELLRLNLDEYWYEHYVSDFLTALSDYPKVDVMGVLQDNNRSEEYRFQFIKNAFQIVYVQSQLVSMQNSGLIVAPKYNIQNEVLVRSYLEMMDVCYRRQLQTNTAPNAVWVQNRYHRILAACVLLSDSIGDYDDEDIVALMQNNKHFSDVYNNYKGFREALKHIIKSETMNDWQKQIVLLSVVSNEWEDFINHIAEYEYSDLESIHSMMELSNYRELNMQLLERYLITLHGNYTNVDISRINAYSSKLGYVLSELKATQCTDINKYNLIVGLLIGICRLKQQSRPSVSYDKLDYSMAKNHELIETNWDLFSAALWATSYETTIMFMFGDDIRNVRKRCTFQKIKLWEKVFRSISQMSVYYYLVSVWYAIDRKREEAQIAYNKIVVKNDIPAQWNQERKKLEAYLEGRNDRFFANSHKNVSTLSAETEAQNLDFIAVAVGSNVVSSEDAVVAYRTIQNNSNKATQLSAYKKLFGFVRKPDDLYEIYRQIDTKKEKLTRKTYNELVIAFSSLLIVEDDEFTHDEKFTILSSMMDVFELLSDINKEKSSIREQLKEAESFVLGTPGLSMETWLNCFEKIKDIMSHYAISNPVGLIAELCIPVEQCIEEIGKCETKMQILEWLATWRNNWNVSSNCSDYERAFVKSVDDELYRLRHGINLHLDVLNEDNFVEDGSIFYQIENIAEKSNISIILNNLLGNDSAQLEVKIGINGESPVVFDNAVFSSIVELRPGDVCGQVYKLHSSVLSRIKKGDRVEVILSVLVDGVPICNNDINKRIFRFEDINGSLTPDIVTAATKYETAVPAFTRMIKGFGRQKEKELIREYLEQQLVVIYGPSRAGKSSLMNYISNDYIDSYCSMPEHSDVAVVSVMIAGEGNTNDYNNDLLNPEQAIGKYDANQMMEYLFLAPLHLAFDTAGQDSRCECYGREYPMEVRERIRNILAQSGSIISKYKAISKILETNNCEIWLMYDEFQQTISRLSGAESELANLCSSIKYSLSRIKLVLCGSDDLLRLFECDNDPKWNDFTIKTAENSVSVGQLESDDFIEMMEDERIWIKLDGVSPYSKAALKLLHQYTGGNAICGKIFGNEILNRLRNGVYAKRRKIYSSDITQIAYSLLSSDVSLVKSLLVAHNTKNLENEMKYLLFIANELANDTNCADVSYRKIKEFFVSRSPAEIDLALKILVARGILKTGADKKRYGFTTMFYFDFFRSQVSETRIQELYDAEHTTQQTNPENVESRSVDEKLLDYFSQQSPSRQAYLLGGLLPNIHDDAKANVRKIVGDWFGGDKYHNELHVNAQTINTAFNTLLTGDSGSKDFLEAFKSMPTVGAYLSESQKAELISLTGELAECETPEDILDAEIRIEALTAPVEQQMLSDTVGAVVASDDFIDVSDERWIELLGIKTQQDLEKIRKLPTEFVTPLGFAVMLHNVFDKISQKIQEDSSGTSTRELDFCPVAIMYCKVVEAVLKKLHTPIYIERIGDATVKFGGIQFRDLLDSDGVTILPSKDLTIGSFAFNIVSTDRNNDIDEPDQFRASPKKSMIKRITTVSDYSASINKTWFSHAKDLAVIQAIRNKSAHEAAPISKSNFEWLVRVLFENGELVRIAELAEEN